jgi:hypothetical protein
MPMYLVRQMLMGILFMRILPCFCVAGDWCKDDKRSQIAQDISRSTGMHNIYLFRREDLEDNLLFWPYHNSIGSNLLPYPGIKIRCIQIFDVKTDGFEVKDGHIVDLSIILHNPPQFRIAYDQESNTIFHLAGFRDRREGFNGLIRTLGIRIESEDDAASVRADYVSLCYQDSRSVDVWNELSLMGAAIRERSSNIDQREFIKNWDKIPSRIRQQPTCPLYTKNQNGYKITYYILENLIFSKVTIVIGKDGQVLSEIVEEILKMPLAFGKAG